MLPEPVMTYALYDDFVRLQGALVQLLPQLVCCCYPFPILRGVRSCKPIGWVPSGVREEGRG
jgi:hypothetical protein